jgi:hypothetical protein
MVCNKSDGIFSTITLLRMSIEHFLSNQPFLETRMWQISIGGHCPMKLQMVAKNFVKGRICAPP